MPEVPDDVVSEFEESLEREAESWLIAAKEEFVGIEDDDADDTDVTKGWNGHARKLPWEK